LPQIRLSAGGYAAQVLYELVLHGDGERLVEVDEPLEVGDALALDDEIWLVLREADLSTVQGRARYECRRALVLRNRAAELVAHAKELELEIKTARDAGRA
jgi:hypothetical protein